MANTSIEMVLRLLFLTISDVNIWFAKKKLIWKSYTTAEALSTNQKFELIDKKNLQL